MIEVFVLEFLDAYRVEKFGDRLTWGVVRVKIRENLRQVGERDKGKNLWPGGIFNKMQPRDRV